MTGIDLSLPPAAFAVKRWFLIEGKEGVGKTEMLRAVAAALKGTYPDKYGCFECAEDITGQTPCRARIQPQDEGISGFDILQNRLDDNQYDFILIDEILDGESTGNTQKLEALYDYFLKPEIKTKMVFLTSSRQKWADILKESRLGADARLFWQHGNRREGIRIWMLL